MMYPYVYIPQCLIFSVKSYISCNCPSSLSTIRVRSTNIISLCIIKVGSICSENPSFAFLCQCYQILPAAEQGNQVLEFFARPQEDHEQCLTAPAVVRWLVKQVRRGERLQEDGWDINGGANRQVVGARGKDKQALIYVCLDMQRKPQRLL